MGVVCWEWEGLKVYGWSLGVWAGLEDGGLNGDVGTWGCGRGMWGCGVGWGGMWGCWGVGEDVGWVWGGMWGEMGAI